MTPTVFFVTRKWPPAIGGMETYSLRLTEALAAHAEVEVAALPGRADGAPPGVLSLLAFPLTVLRRWRARPAPPDILHLGDMAIWPLGLLARLARGRTRVVISAHGTDVAYPRRGGIRGRLYGAYLRLGRRLVRAAVIANSGATREVAAETGWETQRVIPLATDTADGSSVDGRHNGRALFCGRLVRRKGLSWFAREVAPHLAEGFRLDVAGSRWDASEAEALDSPRIDDLGPVPHERLPRRYADALCVILPNVETPEGEYEGFGLVACEAAAAGGVVLAAKRDGLTDAVIDGVTGFLIPSGDAAAWRAAIEEVAGWSAAQRRDFIAASQARARAHFAWERVAQETAAVYREVLGA
ncbi:MAG: glycosyltransferase family 4 protein [Pseudomonadota bacterium]